MRRRYAWRSRGEHLWQERPGGGEAIAAVVAAAPPTTPSRQRHINSPFSRPPQPCLDRRGRVRRSEGRTRAPDSEEAGRGVRGVAAEEGDADDEAGAAAAQEASRRRRCRFGVGLRGGNLNLDLLERREARCTESTSRGSSS